MLASSHPPWLCAAPVRPEIPRGARNEYESLCVDTAAAAAGSASATYRLAQRYADGATLSVDRLRSVQLLERAAALGHVRAHLVLALAHLEGESVAHSCARYAHLVSVAARLGDENALHVALTARAPVRQRAGRRQQTVRACGCTTRLPLQRESVIAGVY